MISLELEKSQVKPFMAQLLKGDLFNAFEARSVEIFTTPRITIDTTHDTQKPTWDKTRPLVYQIIKLCPKPGQIKIIFSYTNPQEIHTNAAALFLNLVYENDGITFTTATAQKEFALDKSMNPAWDNFIREFFAKASVNVTDRV